MQDPPCVHSDLSVWVVTPADVQRYNPSSESVNSNLRLFFSSCARLTLCRLPVASPLVFLQNISREPLAFDVRALGTVDQRVVSTSHDPVSGTRGLRVSVKPLPRSVSLTVGARRSTLDVALSNGSAVELPDAVLADPAIVHLKSLGAVRVHPSKGT